MTISVLIPILGWALALAALGAAPLELSTATRCGRAGDAGAQLAESRIALSDFTTEFTTRRSDPGFAENKRASHGATSAMARNSWRPRRLPTPQTESLRFRARTTQAATLRGLAASASQALATGRVHRRVRTARSWRLGCSPIIVQVRNRSPFAPSASAVPR